jgi:hypothetical protein
MNHVGAGARLIFLLLVITCASCAPNETPPSDLDTSATGPIINGVPAPVTDAIAAALGANNVNIGLHVFWSHAQDLSFFHGAITAANATHISVTYDDSPGETTAYEISGISSLDFQFDSMQPRRNAYLVNTRVAVKFKRKGHSKFMYHPGTIKSVYQPCASNRKSMRYLVCYDHIKGHGNPEVLNPNRMIPLYNCPAQPAASNGSTALLEVALALVAQATAAQVLAKTKVRAADKLKSMYERANVSAERACAASALAVTKANESFKIAEDAEAAKVAVANGPARNAHDARVAEAELAAVNDIVNIARAQVEAVAEELALADMEPEVKDEEIEEEDV